MQINISLPRTNSVSGVGEVASFLKQMELSVHHAQKALKQMDEMVKEKGEETGNIYITLRIKGYEENEEGSYEGTCQDIDIEIWDGN